MQLLKPEFNNLEDLFWNQVKDIYDAEKRITDALPKMADAANDPQLKTAFREHLEQTRHHVERLEQIFRSAGKDPDRETCEGIKGLLKEGDDMIGAKGDDDTCDAGLIAAAQRVEHYEMAVYGTIRTYAERLGRNDFVDLLQRTLNEEGEADKKLTRIAETKINVQAARH
ncbi:MAG TPA: ferritin-like domain-containing protein [Thermoanaerobaculia bacterium]|jgi:ferritin-like metal-binding protein YciE|nr:ferritin-like domain-containing protein [Thermoanaerobaculia bacterium]